MSHAVVRLTKLLNLAPPKTIKSAFTFSDHIVNQCSKAFLFSKLKFF